MQMHKAALKKTEKEVKSIYKVKRKEAIEKGLACEGCTTEDCQVMTSLKILKNGKKNLFIVCNSCQNSLLSYQNETMPHGKVLC